MTQLKHNQFVSELISESPKTCDAFDDWCIKKDKRIVNFKVFPDVCQLALLLDFLDDKKVFVKIHIMNTINDVISWSILDKRNIDSFVPTDGMNFSTREEATKRGIIQAFVLLEKEIENHEKEKEN